MKLVKKFLQNFWAITGFISSIVLVSASQDAGGMISYYCRVGNPFWIFHLQAYALCSLYITLGFIGLGIVIIFLLLCSFEILLFILRRIRIIQNENQLDIKFVPIDDFSPRLDLTFVGAIYYVGLRIHNNGPKIAECTVTLEEIINGGDRSLNSNLLTSVYQTGRLQWKDNHGNLGCGITILPKSKEEIIYVAKNTVGYEILNGKAVNLDTSPPIKFDFSYCEEKQIRNTPFGFYYITIRVDGIVEEVDKQAIWRGWIFSELSSPMSPQLFINDGDPSMDKRLLGKKIYQQNIKKGFSKENFISVLKKFISDLLLKLLYRTFTAEIDCKV